MKDKHEAMLDAAQAALAALETLDGMDTETECVTIDVRDEIAALRVAIDNATQQKKEPFGYFRAEPFGWTACAETDEGAMALYEAQQAASGPLADEPLRHRSRSGGHRGGHAVSDINLPPLREQFEQWADQQYHVTGFTRSYGDGYIGSASHLSLSRTYANIEMLWETWQAARAQTKEGVSHDQ